MWEAFLESIEDREGAVHAIVVFDNKEQKYRKEYKLSPEQTLKEVVKRDIAKLDLKDNQLKLPIGKVDLTEPPPSAPPPASERDQFALLYATYKRLKKEFEVGVGDTKAEDVTLALENVRASYKPEYGDLL